MNRSFVCAGVVAAALAALAVPAMAQEHIYTEGSRHYGMAVPSPEARPAARRATPRRAVQQRRYRAPARHGQRVASRPAHSRTVYRSHHASRYRAVQHRTDYRARPSVYRYGQVHARPLPRVYAPARTRPVFVTAPIYVRAGHDFRRRHVLPQVEGYRAYRAAEPYYWAPQKPRIIGWKRTTVRLAPRPAPCNCGY